MSDSLARRHLLVSSSLALLGVGALAGLAGCKRSEHCPPEELAKLSPEDKKLRETLQYTERSPDPQKLCNACQQYLPDTDRDCGGCKLLKGPIHPAGTCTAFMSKG
jgi:hypothetical protein